MIYELLKDRIINGSSSGQEAVIQSLSIAANGTYTAPSGVDGYSPVIVNVPSSGFKRIELNNGGQQYLFNNYFLDLLDYGCEVVFTNTTQVHNFLKLACGTEDARYDPSQKITGENVDKFASLKINVEGCTLGYGTIRMFYNQSEITHLPQIVGNYNIITNRAPDYEKMFYGCYRLQEIPDNYIGLMIYDSQHNSYIGDGHFSDLDVSSMFKNCYALRKIPTTFSTTFHKKPISGYSRAPQYYGFRSCYSLDEVVDFPVVDTRDVNNPYTSNSFSGSFNDCQRLKRLTFKQEEQSHTEGNETITVYSPTTAYWKNQTIDLAAGQIGFGGSCTSYNPTFTADNNVWNDATYQALKDTEDWWTENYNYSRYNHNSAVETINTLPQIPSDYTNAGNTIKFKGASGSATDGGAINTLTQEEIAVATAKGWTVALV